MAITVQQFEQNPMRYFELSKLEDVFVSQDGRVLWKISRVTQGKKDALRALVGIIPNVRYTEKDAREERLVAA